MAEESFIQACQAAFRAAWIASEDALCSPQDLPTDIIDAIERSINSKTKTYRYVLPTQISAKVADSSLDCRFVQAKARSPRAFDARSVCDSVVVPFDRSHANVLGGSSEPYVNNPLRIERIVASAASAQKDKAGFGDLILVLDFCEASREHAPNVLVQVARAIRRRLAATTVSYPSPRRLSDASVVGLVERFLIQQSGGLRLQVVATALFQAIGHSMGMFSEVRTNSVNAADASTGSVADLECVDGRGSVVLGVEIKDRTLTLTQVQVTSAKVRQKGIAEFLFLIRGGVDPSDASAVHELQRREFANGHNLYVYEFNAFLGVVMTLIGERGRSDFVARIGVCLDESRADFQHRQSWSDALSEV